MAGWTGVIFSGVDLSTLPGVEIIKIDHHKRPVRTNNRQKLARQDGKKLIRSDYDERIIAVQAVLRGTSRANYEQNRDNLFLYLEPQEATLRVPQSGGNRDYTCTVDNIDYTDDPVGGFSVVLMQFVASNPPFGKDTSNTTGSNSRFTGASKTETFVAIGGTVEALPVITVTLHSGTGLTSKYIEIENPATAKAIRITRTWVAGDILIIDCENKTVKVNGTTVDFTGVFPTWRPSDTQLAYEDNLTTRDVTVNMVYKKRWL